jgi:hypothetical protein
MPGTTPLQLYSYPTSNDQASPSGIQTLATQVEKQVVAVFADAATRDSRWPTAGGLVDGAMCFLTDRKELQLRTGGAWVVIGGRAAPFATAAGSAALTFSNSRSSIGLQVNFPTNRFTQPPHIFATGPWFTGGYNYTELSFLVTFISTTSYFLHATAADETIMTATMNVNWMAIQMTSASADG